MEVSVAVFPPMFILASSIVFFKKLQTVLVAAKSQTTESKSICTAQEGQLKLEKKVDDERHKQYLEINKLTQPPAAPVFMK